VLGYIYSPNKRIPRMLIRRCVTAALLIFSVSSSSCSTQSSSYEYCNDLNKSRLVIDFKSKELKFGTTGHLDQVYSMKSCGHSIKTCFVSEIDFINPFFEHVKSNPNFTNAKKLDDSYFIELGYKNKYTRYSIKTGEILPQQFLLSREDPSQTYQRC
jgi:hypothetical protein